MRDLADESATRVEPRPACGMVAIRGALSDPGFAAALDGCGVVVPDRRGIAACDAGQVAWMSPDELLVLCGHGADAGLAARLAAALEGRHHLALPVGDMRARFAVSGPGAHVALAKLCPVDTARLAPATIRRTRLAQVAAAVWRTGDEAFELVCFRSVADYVHTALATAARHVEDIALP